MQFPESEMEEFSRQEEVWFGLNALVDHWREELGGVSEDGWISHERYEKGVRKERELKETLRSQAEGDEEDIRLLERGWPFGNREE